MGLLSLLGPFVQRAIHTTPKKANHPLLRIPLDITCIHPSPVCMKLNFPPPLSTLNQIIQVACILLKFWKLTRSTPSQDSHVSHYHHFLGRERENLAMCFSFSLLCLLWHHQILCQDSSLQHILSQRNNLALVSRSRHCFQRQPGSDIQASFERIKCLSESLKKPNKTKSNK